MTFGGIFISPSFFQTRKEKNISMTFLIFSSFSFLINFLLTQTKFAWNQHSFPFSIWFKKPIWSRKREAVSFLFVQFVILAKFKFFISFLSAQRKLLMQKYLRQEIKMKMTVFDFVTHTATWLAWLGHAYFFFNYHRYCSFLLLSPSLSLSLHSFHSSIFASITATACAEIFFNYFSL